MVDSSCGGTFLHKTADEAWDLFENLSDNSQQHAISSHVGAIKQIGNKVGMYEVSQNVDLSLKVNALSKKFDELLALNTLPTNSLNVQGVCAICSSPSHVIYDCPSALLFPEFVQEQVNTTQGFHKQNDPHSNMKLQQKLRQKLQAGAKSAAEAAKQKLEKRELLRQLQLKAVALKATKQSQQIEEKLLAKLQQKEKEKAAAETNRRRSSSLQLLVENRT
ncbi:hypothetical protein M9H77_04311 [Catharanthus roseus]|uniref:Uncharacterized protein n=1 Tax=Catharanthus roseus TaxID=4058 RepID=A0ACC0CEA5_CATRO|nr:hypothetical protein M9H77_04311 [Catharanthus roseus]